MLEPGSPLSRIYLFGGAPIEDPDEVGNDRTVLSFHSLEGLAYFGDEIPYSWEITTRAEFLRSMDPDDEVAFEEVLHRGRLIDGFPGVSSAEMTFSDSGRSWYLVIVDADAFAYDLILRLAHADDSIRERVFSIDREDV